MKRREEFSDKDYEIFFEEARAVLGLSGEEALSLPRTHADILKLVDIVVAVIGGYPDDVPSEVVKLIGPGPTVKEMLVAGELEFAWKVTQDPRRPEAFFTDGDLAQVRARLSYTL